MSRRPTSLIDQICPLRTLSHLYWLSNNRKCQILCTNKTECRVDSRQPAETALFSLLLRMTVLLAVCLTQSWLLWKFIRFQLRRWREFRHEQATRKKASKQALRPLKRDSSKFGRPAERDQQAANRNRKLTSPLMLTSLPTVGHHENGVLKAENGVSPRTKKLKSP